MKFSVIIPLYNKAPYIRKALESVLAQTYTDYELIIVDDGSTDGSAEIAEAILQEAIRLQGNKVKGSENGEADNTAPHRLIASSPHRLLRQRNAGVSAARNAGVAQAQGEYLAFLDADDWWEPTSLERMAQLINDYPDAGLYACNYVYYKPGKTHVALHIPTGYINYPKVYYESDAMPIWTGAAMIPRWVYDEMGGFPLGIKLGEDFLLWSKIALHYPVAFLNEPLAYYNNDVPVNLRATRNLHHPNNHMLFQMKLAFGGGEILNQQHQQQNLTTIPLATTQRAAGEREMPTCQDWNRLIDKLRVGGLLEYWMSKEYHNLAAIELAKVDWNQQPNSVKRMYKTPICLLKLKRWVMQVGSYCKQRIIKAIRREAKGRVIRRKKIMIPKIIHYCWFGRGEMPELVKQCIASWHKYMPDWEYRLWDEDSLKPILNMPTPNPSLKGRGQNPLNNPHISRNDDWLEYMPAYVQEAYAAKKYAFVSDYVRLWALEREGGLYLDTDVEGLKSFEPLMNDIAFIGLEESLALLPGTCVMACEAHCQWVKDMLATYDGAHFLRDDGSLDMTTNVQRLGERMLQAGLMRERKVQYLSHWGLRVYTHDYFSPITSTRVMRKSKNTYCIHRFAGTWVDGKQRGVLDWWIVREIVNLLVQMKRFLW